MSTSNPQAIARYIAIDAHKHYVVVGGLNAQMEIVLPLRRIDVTRFSEWAQKTLSCTDAIVIEATVNTWTLYDIVEPLVGRVVVANAYQVKLIAAARVKTDKRDVWALARLLVADLVPEVWVPPVHVRELRALIAHRRRLIQIRTRARNRLHSLTHRHNRAASLLPNTASGGFPRTSPPLNPYAYAMTWRRWSTWAGSSKPSTMNSTA